MKKLLCIWSQRLFTMLPLLALILSECCPAVFSVFSWNWLTNLGLVVMCLIIRNKTTGLYSSSKGNLEHFYFWFYIEKVKFKMWWTRKNIVIIFKKYGAAWMTEFHWVPLFKNTTLSLCYHYLYMRVLSLLNNGLQLRWCLRKNTQLLLAKMVV